MPQDAHPYRSVLYMPGSRARALEKARTLAADALILDLEDAVAPTEKENARALVAEAVAHARPTRLQHLDDPGDAVGRKAHDARRIGKQRRERRRQADEDVCTSP